MYHPKKLVNTARQAVLVSLCLTQALAMPACLAKEHKSSPAQGNSSYHASNPSNCYPVVPPRRLCQDKPDQISIFEYDASPLGDRLPFLLVHGLRGEYYQGFRWDALARHFQQSDQFSKRYKLYLARYDSLAPLERTVPLMKSALAQLYETTGKHPLNVMALSIGGNLVYEAMLDRQTDSKVALLVTLGTPFHGSPLFSSDWFKYSLYKNWQLPSTRFDHAIAYRLYFARNPNLLKDFSWDNCDTAIPNIGRFRSLLPLGPSGDLSADTCVNRALVSLPAGVVDPKKLITYAGYLLNPYLLSHRQRLLRSTLLAPYDFCTIELPAHLGKEEPVLKMLDRQIAVIRTNESAAKRAESRFVYSLNDGITPLSSALFLPSQTCLLQSFAKESDIAKIKDMANVRTARVFRNIDHLAFIGGAKPSKNIKGVRRDELNPEAGTYNLFDWMLKDIASCNTDISTIAEQDNRASSN